jgi:hypothetical protein
LQNALKAFGTQPIEMAEKLSAIDHAAGGIDCLGRLVPATGKTLRIWRPRPSGGKAIIQIGKPQTSAGGSVASLRRDIPMVTAAPSACRRFCLKVAPIMCASSLKKRWPTVGFRESQI